MNPSPWEIWWAKVKFEDDPSMIKERPVLVISVENASYISLKMTSSEPRPDFQGEYQVVEWKQAGLTKPTVIRSSKVLELFKRDFGTKIGNLPLQDILNVQNILHELDTLHELGILNEEKA